MHLEKYQEQYIQFVLRIFHLTPINVAISVILWNWHFMCKSQENKCERQEISKYKLTEVFGH